MSKHQTQIAGKYLAEKDVLIYEGKAKKVYSIKNNPELVCFEYKDSLTAFNALKKGSFPNKGRINRTISEAIFNYLSDKGIKTHQIERLDEDTLLCQKLKMILLEVVVRNVCAGSLAKKFGRPEGEVLPEPLVEFYYKDDALADPFISDEQALWLNVATREEMSELKRLALVINSYLVTLFKQADIRLIDFKLEFGKNTKNEIILADEISPDSCRLWDAKTDKKMDKDRFRRDLDNVAESYQEVADRITQTLKSQK
jgi:phosphoribosylaminoimidazole-succinocarboxamide synthase